MSALKVTWMDRQEITIESHTSKEETTCGMEKRAALKTPEV